MRDKKDRNSFIAGAILPQFIGESIARHSTNVKIGAHSIFLGQVRNDLVGIKEVMAIEYTTYKELAEEKIYEIREAIFLKYGLTCLHIYHSLGKVNVGEICLFVFTSSIRRKDAIVACEELVESIKKEVPIWGKEIFENDEYQWKSNS